MRKLKIRDFKILEKTIRYEERTSKGRKLSIEVGEHGGNVRVQCLESQLWDVEHDLWTKTILDTAIIKNPKFSKYNKPELIERNKKMWNVINEFYWRYFTYTVDRVSGI